MYSLFGTRFFLLLTSALLLAACNREIPFDGSDRSIYPIMDGKQRTYFVLDTTYTTTAIIANQYYKRELTNGQATDLNGRTLSKLEIWRATDAQGPFSFFELWTQYLGNEFAERTEGNTRYVVLRFPYLKGINWNGNQFNGFDRESYQYITTDTTIVLGGVTYNNCKFIRQRYQQTTLSDVYTYEIYAPGIGKIKRYDRYIKRNTDGSGRLVIDTDSYVYEETLVGHNY